MANYKFIVNPAASRGGGQRAGKLVQEMAAARNLDFDLEYTEGQKHAQQIAARSVSDFEFIVAVGGDGTINEVVNGLAEKKSKLGVIPVGSGNDFVTAMDIPLKIADAMDLLVDGHTMPIDLGKAEEHYFANGLGIGFDAWVVEQSMRVKHLRGNMIYLYSVLKTMFSYKAPLMRIAYNGIIDEKRMFMISVGNGTSMGGGFKLTPFAKFDDGVFDLNIIRDLNKFEIIQNLLSVYSGKHVNMPQVTTARADALSVESDEGFAAHVDGELIGLNLNSMKITLLPKALNVVSKDH